ncbi:hypothetical protein KQY30_13445 [Streptomyces sp. GMY02]|uniref:hypothetical protein n=1 Tax=Streptomyces sp. GMY02 TaxID=1333528 RepID=UPI001C2BB2A0|nr:hypothetical protein [Streptomyces sp. GMY02]QXE35125.1 hypothetical protein KQY30_13445 [Streptomyces sp. GMY02]
MSFGDPNNPYGQQGQQPGQPGYGYPQGQPGQQPGYGYPQAPPVQPYGGYPGAPGGQMEMPGGVKAARVMLWVISGFQIISGLLTFAAMGAIDDAVSNSGATSAEAETFADLGKGIVGFIAVVTLIFAALSILLALKMKTGGNATRVCAIVYGSFATLGGILSLPLGIVTVALGILIIVFVAKSDGAAWFQRPRY